MAVIHIVWRRSDWYCVMPQWLILCDAAVIDIVWRRSDWYCVMPQLLILCDAAVIDIVWCRSYWYCVTPQWLILCDAAVIDIVWCCSDWYCVMLQWLILCDAAMIDIVWCCSDWYCVMLRCFNYLNLCGVRRAYSVTEDQKWFFLLRKWVIINTTYKFLGLETSHLINVRWDIIIAVLLKVQVFWNLTLYSWVSSCNCVLLQPSSITFQKTWKFHLRIMLYHSGSCFLVFFSTVQCCRLILTNWTCMHPPISQIKESDPSWSQSIKGHRLLQGMWLFRSTGMG